MADRAAAQVTSGKRTGKASRSRDSRGTRHDEAATGSSDVLGQLALRTSFLVGVLGNKRTAEMLNVSQSQPSRWRRSAEVPSAAVAPLLVDLDHVVARLTLVWDTSLVGQWLLSPNAHLEGSRPIDVLAARGSSEVVDAIEAEAAGAFA